MAKKPEMKWRDIMALPFGLLMYLFGILNVQIGVPWTSYTILKIWGHTKE